MRKSVIVVALVEQFWIPADECSIVIYYTLMKMVAYSSVLFFRIQAIHGKKNGIQRGSSSFPNMIVIDSFVGKRQRILQ